MNAIKAVFPGTFDPITNGHIDLVQRAAKLFSRVIVAIAINQGKGPKFDIDTRVKLAREALNTLPNVEVMPFHGLLVDFAHQQNAKTIIRGLRAVADFEYEFQLSTMNHRLAPDIETLFLPAEQFGFVSSSLVTEIAQLGGDVSAFVPPIVAAALKAKFSGK